ncbi:KAP family P-loop NTPase fold protein [Mesorhizobium sp.]|uniref:KAP family P-loop NTPase fold protein n=1 Tax=Mesorhizobium sp. TaxID=1871066 RepID=UPI000FE5434F|nr:P-loop NTPase fold protein [Mesorhizobium sp.]RWP46370.1 MAG: NTPase KAP [Mesorhizobium sp.]RWP70713.1 MAG: NTPase KAP [Mesorhizobium sp.]
MWADSESNVDYLNYSEVSEMICEMIADDAMLPISLGVYGTWGVGKSSILKLVQKELEADSQNLIITFDAWLYQDFDEAKSALMTVIAKTLYDQSSKGLKERAAGLYRRVNKLKLLGIAADAGALAAGIPTFGMFGKAAESLEDIWEGTGDEADVKVVKDAANDAGQRAKGLLKPNEKRNAPEEIAAFRKEFEDLLNETGRRLVVFVDNLDRCLPANAISTLEAMRLFLFLPNTAFIVAADEEMIRLAVAKHFSDPGDRHITDYLDKLIQVPIRVPKLGLQEVRAYLAMLAIASAKSVDAGKVEAVRAALISKLRKSWSEEPPFEVKDVVSTLGISEGSELAATLESMDRLAPLLAHSVRVNGNPRIVKRLLNVIRMRSKTAKRRGMPLSESFIAKLALFERIVGEEAIQQLGTLVNAAPNGKPTLFSEFETWVGEIPAETLPIHWQKQAPFVLDWLKLDPMLAGVDLGPAVYLARETLPLRVASTRLSPVARQSLGTLLKTVSTISRASKDAIAAIPAAEVGDVMEEMISAMSRNLDWSKARPDFRGAAMLAKADATAHGKLVRFAKTIETPPRWMTALMKDDEESSVGGNS